MDSRFFMKYGINRDEAASVLFGSNTALQEWAKKLVHFKWGIELDIPVYFVRDLPDHHFGSFTFDEIENIQYIKINQNRLSSFREFPNKTINDLFGVLLHELTHWKVYNDGSKCREEAYDGHPTFEFELLKVGAPTSHVFEGNIFYRVRKKGLIAK